MNGNALRPDRRFTASIVLLLAALLCMPGAHGQDAATLRACHMALREQLAHSPFQRPLVLESTQTDGTRCRAMSTRSWHTPTASSARRCRQWSTGATS